MEILIYGHKIHFDENYILSARFFYFIHLEAIHTCTKMLAIYDSLDTLSDLIDYGQQLKDKVYGDVINTTITTINNELKANVVDRDSIIIECNKVWGKFEITFALIFETYLETSNEKNLAKKYYELKKGSIYNNSEDPSSIKKAANELVDANVNSLTLDSVHTIFNLVDNSHVTSHINDHMKKVLNDPINVNAMSDAIYEDIFNILGPLINILQSKTTFRMCYSYEDFKKSKKISEDIENDLIPKEKLKDYIAQMIYLSPFEPKNYALSYYIFSDLNGELENIANTFRVDIDFNSFKEAEKNARKFFGEDYYEIDLAMIDNLFYKQTKDLLGDDLVNLLYECKFLFGPNLQKLLFSKLENTKYKQFNTAVNLFGCFSTTEENPLIVFENGTASSKDGFIITDKSIYFYIGPIMDLISIEHINFNANNIIINETKIPMNWTNLINVDLLELTDFFTYFLIVHKYYIKNMISKVKYEESNNFISTSLFAFKSKFDIIEYAKELMNIFNDEDLKSCVTAVSDDPHIKKKFRNAMDSYAFLEEDEYPLICFDNTAFGSAKEGCLITSKGIHIHNSFLKPRKFIYEAITSIEINRTNPLTLIIDDFELQTTLLSSLDSKIKFCSILNKIKKDLIKNNNLIAFQNDSPKPVDYDSNLIQNINEILNTTPINLEIGKNIYCYSKSPKVLKKFENAITTYVVLDEGERPILCYDNTIFGSAKEGCIVTSKCIHIHNSFSKPQKFYFDEIKNITLQGTSAKTLFINNFEIQTTTLSTLEAKTIFWKSLIYILENIKK